MFILAFTVKLWSKVSVYRRVDDKSIRRDTAMISFLHLNNVVSSLSLYRTSLNVLHFCFQATFIWLGSGHILCALNILITLLCVSLKIAKNKFCFRFFRSTCLYQSKFDVEQKFSFYF